MTYLSSEDYWNHATHNAKIELASDDPIKNWIESKNIDFNNIVDCIEIGCYPGRFLTIFGKFGKTLHGIDYVNDLPSVELNLKKLGYKTGEFINADILNYDGKKLYGCVMSFGLIEHFSNWEDVFLKHLSLVEKGGYLIIEVPNFRGFLQRLPRRLYDLENYKRHNINSMNLRKWEKLLNKNNFEILSKDYFGGYDVWFENENISQSRRNNRNKLVKRLTKIKSLLFPNETNNKHFSSYMGIIAKKK